MKHFNIYGLPTDRESKRELAHRKLSREAAAEGMVLLKNDGTLPLRGKKLALFGIGARKTVKGGSGSGDVHERYNVNIEDGMKNAGYEILNTSWLDGYDKIFDKARADWVQDIERKIKGFAPWNVIKMFDVIHESTFIWPMSDAVKTSDLDDSGVAMYVIGRQAGEGADRTLRENDWFLSGNEISDLKLLASHYNKVIVVINCGGMLDLSPLDEIPNIGAIIYFVQGGQEGGNALGDIISGKISPSGKLTDTWARRYEDYPCADSFGSMDGNPDITDYREGIYVGYRWFDAFDITPRYPFGFGLSYTTFDITVKQASSQDTQVTVPVTIKNTGVAFAGKEVTQLYIEKPQGKLSKERQLLSAFVKTALLAPGECQTIHLNFDIKDCASYDEDTASFILEKGDYGVYIGNSSADTTLAAVVSLDETVVTERLTNICPVTENFEEIEAPEHTVLYPETAQRLHISADAVKTRIVQYTKPEIHCKTEKVKGTIEALTETELIELCVGGGYGGRVVNNSSGCAGRTTTKLLKHGIPNINLADGPSGINLMPKNAYTKSGSPRYVDALPADWQWGWLKKIEPFVLAKPGKGLRAFHYMTAFPVPALQAQTWNEDLVTTIGAAIGTEMLESGVSVWLAPGLNIHRNPLCGRNFEYYSEDPLLSGKMAAAITKGVQSHDGIGVCIKHLCCNNQEERRDYMSSDVHERTLREIYLRGFSIAVREGKPWTVMSSYNKVNSVYTPNSYDLLTKALRNEWGFDGFVMSDWNATEGDKASHCKALSAGNDMIMPGSKAARESLAAGLQDGRISREDLQRSATNILNLLFDSAVVKGDEKL